MYFSFLKLQVNRSSAVQVDCHDLCLQQKKVLLKDPSVILFNCVTKPISQYCLHASVAPTKKHN